MLFTTRPFLLFLFPLLALAQVNVAFDENDVLNWAGLAINGSNDIAPRGLEALSDGRIVYFEDSSNLPSAKQDAILLFDPSLVGNARFSVIASELQMRNLAPTANFNIHVSDLVRDGQNNLYALATEYNGNKSVQDNFVLKVPFQNGNFLPPVFVVDVPDGGLSATSTTRHRLAVDGNQLYVLYDTQLAANNGANWGCNGVYHFDMSGGIPGLPGDLELFSSYQTLGALASVPLENGQNFGIWQIRADGQGSIFGLIYLNGANQVGDLIKIAANGQATLFRSALEMESETGWLNGFGTNTSMAINRNNGHFFFFETGTSNSEKEILYEFDANAHFIRQICAGPQILAAAPFANPSLTTIESNALAVDDSGKLYTFLSKEERETLLVIDPAGINYQLPAFIWPNGEASYDDVASPFGPRQLHSENGRYDFHRGIDMSMAEDSKIYAVADGTVVSLTSKTLNDCNGVSNTEYTLGIRHGNAAPYVYSFYLHLKEVFVAVGDSVTQGNLLLNPSNHIALSGEKSESCYAHLHFEIRIGSTQESSARNPLEYLPYQDQAVEPMNLVGLNHVNGERLYYFEFTAADEELDLNALGVSWNGSAGNWNWADSNKANGGTYDTRMDHPLRDFTNEIYGGFFPEPMNQSSSAAQYGYALAGLSGNAPGGTATVMDIHQNASQLALPLQEPELQMTPVSDHFSAQAGSLLQLQVEIQNPGLFQTNVELEIRSSRSNAINLNPSDVSFILGPGASRVVAFSVQLNPNAPYGVGDAILVSADTGGNLKTMSLFAVEQE